MKNCPQFGCTRVDPHTHHAGLRALRPSKNGAVVAEFEKAFASYVGARFAIALCNGTATIHTALVAMGVKPGDRVSVPPLTMSATTIAVLHAGAVPVFEDVDPATWLIAPKPRTNCDYTVPVSLYGLHQPYISSHIVDDAAQTLRPHGGSAFTSYSSQASKILSTGEGGMLVTDSEELATKAREFSSLGYRMRADQPRIDPATIKSRTFDRHHSLGWNYRMNDVTAAEGLRQLAQADALLYRRAHCADMYRTAIESCDWLTPQHVPEGWRHDYWTFAVACDTPERAAWLADAIVTNGGERPYPAWRLTYQEPAFRHLNHRCVGTFADRREPGIYEGDLRRVDGSLCPVAESLQPRLLQFQTNSIESAEKNALALRKAIQQMAIQSLANSLDVFVQGRMNRASFDSDATGIPCG